VLPHVVRRIVVSACALCSDERVHQLAGGERGGQIVVGGGRGRGCQPSIGQFS
jgi:hypothetical protein